MEVNEVLVSSCAVCKTIEVTSLDKPAPDVMCDCGEVKEMYITDSMLTT